MTWNLVTYSMNVKCSHLGEKTWYYDTVWLGFLAFRRQVRKAKIVKILSINNEIPSVMRFLFLLNPHYVMMCMETCMGNIGGRPRPGIPWAKEFWDTVYWAVKSWLFMENFHFKGKCDLYNRICNGYWEYRHGSNITIWIFTAYITLKHKIFVPDMLHENVWQ